MEWTPAVASDGIAILLINIPLERVTASVPGIGVMVVLSNRKTRAVLAGKLEPLMSTSVPACPEAGLSGSRVAPGVTVKVNLTEIYTALGLA